MTFNILLTVAFCLYTEATVCVKSSTFNLGQQWDLRANVGASIPRQVSGTLQLLDGCTFQVSNFSIYPPCAGTYWAGIPKGQPSGKLYQKIVKAAISSFDGQTALFSLDVSGGDLQNHGFPELDGLATYCTGENVLTSKVLWVPDVNVMETSSATGLLISTNLFILGALAFYFLN